jgi:NADPH:quinone reductase-like Zn-dependent oxidoreductase
MTMKAAYIDAFASSGNIKVGQLSLSQPRKGEVCIAVAYAGVNPVDGKIAEGALSSRMPHQFPLILGWEASGTVYSLGEGVTSFQKGDKVYAYCKKPVVQEGTWAEYVTVSADHVALAPSNISMAEAAGVPLAGLTAWQALFDKVQLKAGEHALIHGGGGGVGGFAIQWAKFCGALVIATASSAKTDYVKRLGADAVIDYQKGNFVDGVRSAHPKGIDVVFDTIGGSVYKQSFEVLKAGGRIVSILEQPDPELVRKFSVRAEYLFVAPNGKQLKEIARLFELGKVRPPVVQQMTLDQAPLAVDAIREGHTMGKIVLRVS